MAHAFNSGNPASERTIDQMLLLKAVVSMATVALVVAGSVSPQLVAGGLSWGQGLIAALGGSLGAYLALHKQLFSYPADSPGLYRWILLFLIGYMILAYVLRYMRGEHYTDTGHEFMLTQLFNGTTFAGSCAVLWGVLDPKVMKIVGDTTMFLLLAGVAGVLYSTRQLVRTRRLR